MAKEFLDIKELATCLNLKQSTLYSLVARGQIPHYRFGRLLRFKKAEIDYWLETHRIAQKDYMGLRMEDISQDPTVDVVNSIVEKAIEEVTGKRYITNHGKPDRVKGLRKEVENVTQ